MSEFDDLEGWPEQDFVRDFGDAVEQGIAALFCGAGTSIAAGFVDWKGLLATIAHDLKLDIDRADLLSLAQYGHNRYGRGHINERIVDEFVRLAKPNRLQNLLARLPIDTVWTTNYDPTLEDTYRAVGRVPDVKIDEVTLATHKRSADVTVYKMHGDASRPDQAVITKDDYEGYALEKRGQAFSTALQAALFSRTFLFLGFSFTDPNIDQILSRIRYLIGESGRQHYCIMRRPPTPSAHGAERAQQEYDVKRTELQIDDLKRRYKIRTVLVDEYGDVASLLERLGRLSRRNTVFVSGAATKHAPLDRRRMEGLLGALGARLERSGKTLVSGMGVAIGADVERGFFQSAYDRGEQSATERAVLRPFPQAPHGGANVKRFWTTYRKDMIGRAGFAVFVAGNKPGESDDEVVRSDGMDEELAIAIEYGAIPIPIGMTGDVAREIWERAIADPIAFYPAGADVVRYLEVLGDAHATDQALIDAVFDIMEECGKARRTKC